MPCRCLFKVILIILVFAFMSEPVAASQPRYGGTLLFGTMGQPLNTDPGVIIDSESAQVASQIYETLVKYDSEKNRYTPVLAVNWKSTPDKKKWIFYLRKNVKFHDGTPFNAQSVKFSWERQRNVRHHYHNPSYGKFVFYRCVWGGYPGNIKKIEAINNYTLKVTLYSRGKNFLKIISRLPFAVVSPKSLVNKKAVFTKKPVGTGPFVFYGWRDWMRLEVRANKNYWNGRPYLEHVVFEPFPGLSTRYRLAKRRWVDILENPLPKLIKEIKKGDLRGINILRLSGTNFSYIALNCKKPPLDNKLVRKALCYAVNKKNILQKLKYEMIPVSSPFMNIYGFSVSSIKEYPYNPKKAKALLKKAGYPNGFPMELWYIKISRPYLVSPEKVGEKLAEDFRKIGIKVRLMGVKWEKYSEKLRYGDYQAAITGSCGIDYDPFMYFQLNWGRNNDLLGSTNITFYRNEKIYRYIAKMRASKEKKRALYIKKIQEILAEACPIVPLFKNHNILIVNKKVRGLKIDRDGIIDFSRVWMD